MADVFISYKRERRPAARHLEQILTRYGYSVWFDLALVRGADYEDQIQSQLNAAKAVIVLWCGQSVRSAGVRSEASRAKDQGKLVPVRIEPCELPLFSTLEQNIDLTAASGSPRDRAPDPVLDDLERLVGRPPLADLRALRDYEATWRAMGALTLARFPVEQAAVADEPVTVSPPPAPPYAFWERQWDKQSAGTNLVALRAIAEEAPGYFAFQAKARIAEIEAEQRYRAEGRIKVDARIIHGAPEGWLKPGAGKTEWFKDIDTGPEMVVVPGAAPFAIGRFALTFAEWDAAQAHPEWQRHSAIASRKPNDYNWGRGKQPAINVSWNDAKAYCAWLSAVTGKTYRLPSEAEWEQACRAGTKSEFWWGNEISTAQANYDGNYTIGNGKNGEYRQRTVPVDSFEANPWGLYQVHGNVWEWCEDAYDASSRVLRGGSWDSNPVYLRSSFRLGWDPFDRSFGIGFRVVRSLSPA